MPSNKSKSKNKSKSQRQHRIDLEEKKLKIKSQLKKLGEQIYEDLDKQQFPTINFPSRSVRNIVYDEKTKQYILGSNTVSRNASNMKHIRPFTQMTWLAFFATKFNNINSKKLINQINQYSNRKNIKNVGMPCFENDFVDFFTLQEIDNLIKLRKNKQELKFLFVGINWEQKGGYEALSIVRELTKKGLKSRLVVVGCIPEFQDKLMDVFGFLRKDKAEDLNKLTELYKSASFFLLPTKAECVGMSFIEAASFGLPAIGTNVGGVPEAVIDGETGIIIQRNDTSDMIAEKIFQIWKKKI